MGLVEVFTVEPLQSSNIVGAHVEIPQVGQRVDASAFDVQGWVLPAHGALAHLHLILDGTLIRTMRPNRGRPDIASAFPSGHDPLRTGFFVTLDLGSRRPESELLLRAAVAGQPEPVAVSRIAFKRVWREVASADALVSVVIPCYRQAHYLPQAIESVLAQTHSNIEIVVVDDGSPDNASQVAKQYPGVRCIRQENKGLAAARNAGIRSTNGEFLVFLDADDRLLPNAVADGLASLARHPEAAFTAGRCQNITDRGDIVPRTLQPPRPNLDPLNAQLLDRFIWAGSTVMYRRSLFEFVDPFDVENGPSCDYDLYLRVMRDHPVTAHEAVVAQYRKHGRAMTRDPVLMLPATARTLARQRDYLSRDPAFADAFRTALRKWRMYYSLPLAEQIRNQLRMHRWRAARRGLVTLARYDPRRLPALVRMQAMGPDEGWPEGIDADDPAEPSAQPVDLAAPID